MYAQNSPRPLFLPASPRTTHSIPFPFCYMSLREGEKERNGGVCMHNWQPWIWRNFSPCLFRSLRPHGLIEERAPWPCGGRQASTPTRRRRTMSDKLPSTQEALLVLGSPRNQAIQTHHSILMGYLLKCTQTQQSFCRQKLQCTMMKTQVKKKSTHPTQTPRSQQREGFFFCDSKNHLDLDQPTTDPTGRRSSKQISVVATGRTEPSLAEWWGNSGAGAVEEAVGAHARVIYAAQDSRSALVSHPSLSIRGVGLTPCTPAAIKPITLLSPLAKKRQWRFHFSYLWLFSIGNN